MKAGDCIKTGLRGMAQIGHIVEIEGELIVIHPSNNWTINKARLSCYPNAEVITAEEYNKIRESLRQIIIKQL